MTSPLLTIAVPTYNRLPSLRRSLEELMRQIDSLTIFKEQIELIVSDNCSTDGTDAFIASFRNRPMFKAYRNSENLGMEGNFICCFAKASGDYVWTFSDDDLLRAGALQKVVDYISHTHVDLIYVPARWRYGDLQDFENNEVTSAHIHRVSPQLFTLEANGVLSFLSSVIVNKKQYAALRGNEHLTCYKGTFLAHYEWIYTLLDRGSAFAVVSRPLVIARTGATGGYDLFKVFGEYYVRIGNEKLVTRAELRRTLELAMLYIHIPGFIYRCREKSFGTFSYSPQHVSQEILSAYGRSLFYTLVIQRLLFSGSLVSKGYYYLSVVLGKLWKQYKRTRYRK